MADSVKKKAQEKKSRNKPRSKNAKTVVYPAKPWRNNGLENGTHGVNVREPSSVPMEAFAIAEKSPGSVASLQVRCPVTTRSIAYLAMGIVLKAIKQGSMSAQESNQCPYYQFRYLIDVFTAVMSSGTMKLTAAPQWLWELCYSLKPKERPCKTGYTNYSWIIEDDGQGFDQAFTLGTGEDNYTLFWGTGQSPSAVAGFPILAPVGPYTEDLGLESISALWNYVMQSGEQLIGDPGAENVRTGNDTSAFAVVYPELGESYFGEGGVRTTIYSERHIDSPLLCQFSKYQEPSTTYWRGWHDARVGSGSPTMIGPHLIDTGARHLRNKSTPILKFYNFDEFFEQLSLICCYAQERLQASGQQITPCPFTAQATAILLRQVILQVCNNEVAQDVRYSGTSFVDMLPFTVGPNGTLSGGVVPMMLPTFLGENIRAIGSMSTKTSKKFSNTVTWYPILARPPSKDLPKNYTFGTDNTPLYVVDPAEQLINLVDVSAIVGQNTVYLDLTRKEIQAMLSHWNDWITKLTAVMSPLIIVSSEKGLRAVNCNVYSNLVEEIAPPPGIEITPNGPQVSKKGSSKGKNYGSMPYSMRMTDTVLNPTSYFHATGDRKIVSVPGFSRALEQIIENWILPVNYSIDGVNDASSQGYQAFMCEIPSHVRSSAGGVGNPGNFASAIPEVFDRHVRSAQFDVKAFATTNQQNEVIASFVELAKMGRGGFLTSALTGVVNAFLPGLGTALLGG